MGGGGGEGGVYLHVELCTWNRTYVHVRCFVLCKQGFPIQSMSKCLIHYSSLSHCSGTRHISKLASTVPIPPFPATKTKKFAPNTIGNFILFHTMLLYSNTANFVINKAFHQIRTQTRLESEEREQSVPLADMQVNI